MVAYPKQAKELVQLLEEDQAEKRAVGAAFFHTQDKAELEAQRAVLPEKTRQRSVRMLEILKQIGEPSISSIGSEGAQAVSVLAVHDSINTLRQILRAFTLLYERDRNDTYYQAIPTMTDRLLLLERKPQLYGTQWMFDEHKQPFLPTVQDFEHVNERRAEYGIDPLRWPKSLAIPESEQPWLKWPLSELVMRTPTNAEYQDFAQG